MPHFLQGNYRFEIGKIVCVDKDGEQEDPVVFMKPASSIVHQGDDILRGATIKVVQGTGIGQTRIVIFNDVDSITVANPWIEALPRRPSPTSPRTARRTGTTTATARWPWPSPSGPSRSGRTSSS